MRRVIFAINLIIITLLFTSCINNSKDITSFNLSFSGIVEINDTNNNYKCKITYSTNDVAKIKILEPNILNGLTFNWLGNNYNIEYKELLCKSDVQYLSETSFASVLIDVLNKCNNSNNLKYVSKNNDIITLIGNIENSTFTVEYNNKSNILKKIKINKLGYKYIFSNIINTN